MPDQADHDKPENLVESSQELEREAARTLEQAVDSHATLEGFYSMNNIRPDKKLEQEATRDRADTDEHREKGHPVP